MNPESNPPVPTGFRCLLCDAASFKVVWSLTGTDVRKLWRTLGCDFSERAFGRLTPEREVTQFECRGCGFRFFDPALAGDARFYEEFEHGDYYVENRTEFDFALALGRREKIRSVLDVGGGEGAFLDHARRADLTTFAVELNNQAAAACAAKGHRTIRKPLERVTLDELDGGVDLLTLFQVAEHVPDPCGFVRHATRLIKSGGFLVVSVPNNLGVHVLHPFDPANMPPHHVSRWRMNDLETLGARCGLNVVERGTDVLYGRGLQEFWLLHNRLADAIGRQPHPGGRWLPSLISFVYRKLGCRYFLPRRGLSIYVAYRKP